LSTFLWYTSESGAGGEVEETDELDQQMASTVARVDFQPTNLSIYPSAIDFT